MATGQVEIDVPAPPAEVWALVGDFCKVDALLTGVESFRCDGNERVIGVGGIEIVERLLEADEDGHVLRYGIVGGLPVDHHEATISVVPIGGSGGGSGGGSRVTWSFDVLPDRRAPMMTATYTAALEALRDRFA